MSVMKDVNEGKIVLKIDEYISRLNGEILEKYTSQTDSQIYAKKIVAILNFCKKRKYFSLFFEVEKILKKYGKFVKSKTQTVTRHHGFVSADVPKIIMTLDFPENVKQRIDKLEEKTCQATKTTDKKSDDEKTSY